MAPRKTGLDTLAIDLLVVCSALWGLQQVLIKATITEIPPMFQARLRMVGATVLLFGTLWLKELVTPGLLLGLGAVAVGIVLVNRKRPV
jgi:drug/metabolite transporter (DMT)-like permease